MELVAQMYFRLETGAAPAWGALITSLARLQRCEVPAAAEAPSTFAHGGAPTPSTWVGRKKHALLKGGGRELDLRHCSIADSAGLAKFLNNFLVGEAGCSIHA